MADYGVHRDARTQTYGDIMEVLGVKSENVAVSLRNDAVPKKARFPWWLKLTLVAAVAIVLIDRLNF